MASSMVSGISENPQMFASDPPQMRKPPISAYRVNDEDTKVSFSCGNGSLFLKLSSMLMVLSCILQVIAIGAPYWAAGWRRDKMSWHEGVWMTCYRTELDNKWICGSYDYSNPTPGIPTWYSATQAMCLISLVIFLPALLINFCFTMHPKGKMYKGLLWFNFFLTLATALLPLMMVLAFAIGHPRRDRFPISYIDEEYDDSPFEFHFCFIFEIIAVSASVGAFVLEILDFNQNEYSDH